MPRRGKSRAKAQGPIPTSVPRRHPAKCRKGVAIGAAASAHTCGQLGIGKGYERAGNSGDNEGENDGRPGLRCRCDAREHKNTRADHIADAEEGEVRRRKAPLQPLAFIALRQFPAEQVHGAPAFPDATLRPCRSGLQPFSLRLAAPVSLKPSPKSSAERGPGYSGQERLYGLATSGHK